MLSLEEPRDADTWGVRLWALRDRGFAPQATIADVVGGLRAAQAEALPGVPCRGAVFHALQTATPLVGYWENRAYEAMAARRPWENRQSRMEHRHGRKEASRAGQRRYAREAAVQALTLAFAVGALLAWLRQDVLAVRGGHYAERWALSDWIVAELQSPEPACRHRIRPVRVLLENQREALLAFAKKLDEDLQGLAQEYEVPATLVAEVRGVLNLSGYSQQRWHREAQLGQRWGSRYGLVRQAVSEVLDEVVRASSVSENLTRRLRSYFFWRRHLGGD